MNTTTAAAIAAPYNTKRLARETGLTVSDIMARIRDLDLPRAYSTTNRVWYIETRAARFIKDEASN